MQYSLLGTKGTPQIVRSEVVLAFSLLFRRIGTHFIKLFFVNLGEVVFSLPFRSLELLMVVTFFLAKGETPHD